MSIVLKVGNPLCPDHPRDDFCDDDDGPVENESAENAKIGCEDDFAPRLIVCQDCIACWSCGSVDNLCGCDDDCDE